MTTSGADRSGPDQLAPVGRTLGIARPASRRVVVATILGAGAIAADIGLLGTAAWLISKAAQHPNEATLAVAIVAVQFFGLSRGFLRYEERLVGHDAAFRLLADLRVRVYRRLERLAPSGLPSFRRGDLLARMVQDVDSLQDLVLRVVPPFGIALLVGVSTVVLLWWMLPAAALILAVALVLAATVVPWLTGWLARRREARFAAVRGDLGAAMVDLTEGAAELIAFGAADAHIRTIRDQDAELTAIASASAGTAGVGLALTTLLAGLACWGCLLVGIPAVLSGRLGGTELAVITLIPLAAFELVVGLPVATQALQRVRQAAARVFEVLDAARTRARSRDHRPAARRALRPGRAVGVGRLSGSSISRSAWRRSLACPSAGAWPSWGRAGRASRPSLRCWSASCRVGPAPSPCPASRRSSYPATTCAPWWDWSARTPTCSTPRWPTTCGSGGVTPPTTSCTTCSTGSAWPPGSAELPQGLATEVGAHGARLSGGQRQRLAVARALLADFPVLVLDEPAEHLEPAAADALTADLLAVTDGRSLVLITHRLAGLESVDEILVMEHGRVVERGTHDELLGRAGRYSDLWWEEMRTARDGRSPEEPMQHGRPQPTTALHEVAALNDGSFSS